jgi:ParB-like chromosome segregation protein Spo0J
MSTTALPFHPLADFPPMEDDEFAALVADIKANGLLEPIVLYQDKILDGCHRHKACLKTGVEPRFEEFKGDDAAATAFVISANIRRRHLTAEQKRELIAKLLKEDPSKSDRQIAKTAKASPTYVGKVRAEKEATGDVSTVDTRTDTRGRKLPAKKTTKAARKQKARERRKTIGKDGKTRRRPAKKAKPKISKASSKLANLVIDTVLPKVEAGKTAATSADDAAACDLELAEQLQAAKIKIAGLESEVEELRAENAELRAKLEAAAG